MELQEFFNAYEQIQQGIPYCIGPLYLVVPKYGTKDTDLKVVQVNLAGIYQKHEALYGFVSVQVPGRPHRTTVHPSCIFHTAEEAQQRLSEILQEIAHAKRTDP